MKTKKDELIKKQDEYITFLAEKLSKVSAFGFARGKQCSQEIVDKGIKLRKEIEDLKSKDDAINNIVITKHVPTILSK